MPTTLKRIEHRHKAQLRLNGWKQRKLEENRLHEFVTSLSEPDKMCYARKSINKAKAKSEKDGIKKHE